MSTTRACGIGQFAEPPRPNLELLVRNFDRDAARSKRLIRQLVDEDQPAFLSGALDILKRDTESRGAQHLIGLLVERGLFVAALCEPSLTRDNAFALAQAAGRIDPMVDVKLARTLAERAAHDDGATGFDQYARLMEILAAISDGARIFPSLVRLLRHSNAHVRSKAVLMIGRGNRSPQWLRQRLADTDPRIRANAAEALWGVRTEEGRELLLSLVHDSHNRVAGNAMLGLYRLGDCAVIPELAGMARHESALFRATAAWVMGETGDPRFTEILAGLLREHNAVVRKRAFAALGAIRAAVTQARQGPRWRVAARLIEADNAKPGRRLLLGVVGEEGALAPSLVGTQILLNEDGQTINQYRVAERPLPETMSVVFVLPRSGAEAAMACLPWKRPSDLWGCVHYSREMPVAPPPNCGLRLHSSEEAIAAEFERVPPVLECVGLWASLASAVDIETGALAGKRHLIVFSEPTGRGAAGDELISAVAAAQAFVQVISTERDAVMEDFCRRVNGLFLLAGENAAVAAYANLFARYEVSYQPPNPEACALKIRVHGRGMCAETSLPLPG